MSIDAVKLNAHDPRFLYYLGALDWESLGPLPGVEVVVPSAPGGDLQIIHPVSVEHVSILDEQPSKLLWHPSASRLLELLGWAYGSVARIKEVCTNVPRFDPLQVFWEQAASLVWKEVVQVAANGGILKALIKEVLRDSNSRRYHGAIRYAVACRRRVPRR